MLMTMSIFYSSASLKVSSSRFSCRDTNKGLSIGWIDNRLVLLHISLTRVLEYGGSLIIVNNHSTLPTISRCSAMCQSWWRPLFSAHGWIYWSISKPGLSAAIPCAWPSGLLRTAGQHSYGGPRCYYLWENLPYSSEILDTRLDT